MMNKEEVISMQNQQQNLESQLNNVADDELIKALGELDNEQSEKLTKDKLLNNITQLQEDVEKILKDVDEQIGNLEVALQKAENEVNDTYLDQSVQKFLCACYNTACNNFVSKEDIEAIYGANKANAVWLPYLAYLKESIETKGKSLQKDLQELYENVNQNATDENLQEFSEAFKSLEDEAQQLYNVVTRIIVLTNSHKVPFLLYHKNSNSADYERLKTINSFSDEIARELDRIIDQYIKVNANASLDVVQNLMIYLLKKIHESNKFNVDDKALKELGINLDTTTPFDRIPLKDMLHLFTGKPILLIKPKQDIESILSSLIVNELLFPTAIVMLNPILALLQLVFNYRIMNAFLSAASNTEKENPIDEDKIIKSQLAESEKVEEELYKLLKRNF